VNQPHNTEAEDHVLGAILLDERCIDIVAEALTPADFYRDSNKEMYLACLDLRAAQKPIDGLTLSDALEKRGTIVSVGGRTRLAELVALMPTVANVGHHARIVNETAQRRRIMSASYSLKELADSVADIDELRQAAEDAMTKAMETGTASTTSSIVDGLDELVEMVRQAYRDKAPMTGKLTGFTALDQQLLGMWPGQLVIIAARPAQGKSTLALNIAENFSDRNEHVLFVTLEMSKFELQIKSLARASRADSRRLMTGQLTEEEAQRLAGGIKTVKDREDWLQVEDNGDTTVQKLAATASKMKRTQGLGLIVVDYIQLMTATVKSESRAEQIGSISRGLKQLARRLDVPVLALAQMNRAVEARSDHRPVMSDLRESGTLEQDADVVMFIHDETSYDAGKDPKGEVELIVVKNRRGPTGSVKMLYVRRWSGFQDVPGPGSGTLELAERAA
jgi:replicative DNA helicase